MKNLHNFHTYHIPPHSYQQMLGSIYYIYGPLATNKIPRTLVRDSDSLLRIYYIELDIGPRAFSWGCRLLWN